MACDTLIKYARVVRPGGSGVENLDTGFSVDTARGRCSLRPTYWIA